MRKGRIDEMPWQACQVKEKQGKKNAAHRHTGTFFDYSTGRGLSSRILEGRNMQITVSTLRSRPRARLLPGNNSPQNERDLIHPYLWLILSLDRDKYTPASPGSDYSSITHECSRSFLCGLDFLSYYKFCRRSVDRMDRFVAVYRDRWDCL